MFGSTLPFVAGGQTKVLTATVTLPNGQVEAAYNGPVTLYEPTWDCATSSPCGPLNLWNGSRFIMSSPITVTTTAVDGVAQFKIQAPTSYQTTGGTLVAAVPGPAGIHSAPLSIATVASNTAQVGFAFFTATGTRISYQHPLQAVAQRAVPLTLKPVNALGQPMAATQGAVVVFQAAQGLTASPPYTVPQASFFVQGLPYFVPSGTQAVSVLYASPVSEPQVFWASDTSTTAVFAEFIPSSGAPLAVVDTASGATVAGIQPHTTYTVVVDGPLPLPQDSSSPVAQVTVTSSARRSSPALTSTPALNQEGQWTFTYQSGSAAQVGDTIHIVMNYTPELSGGPWELQAVYSATVTTNPY